MYIAPNSTIKILKNVPLDPTYEHTLYFTPNESGKTAQSSYFSSKSKYTFTEQSYQRVNRGRIRLAAVADNLYDCNYLMFQNTNFGSKWFYAFITSIEYINNAVCEIQYEIDVMQTWHTDYSLEQCFVERQHTVTDTLFGNITPEDINVSNDYICNDTVFIDLSKMKIAIIHTNDDPNLSPIYKSIGHSVVNNIYMGMYFYLGATISELNSDTINNAITAIDPQNILAVYQYPALIAPDNTGSIPSIPYTISINRTIDGYTPKNKKLFTYPYNYVLLSNNSDKTHIYKWEYFDSPDSIGYSFNITGTYVSTPVAIMYPSHYRGVDGDYDDGLTLTNFPECGVTIDTFNTWWNTNRTSFITGSITSIIGSLITGRQNLTSAGLGILTSLATKDAPGIMKGIEDSRNTKINTAFNIGSTIANSIATVQDMKMQPDSLTGQLQTDCLNASIGRTGYTIYKCSIKREYARIIDDYFTRFGYAIKRNIHPIRNARPHWTYVKTLGCTLTGSIPSDDVGKICKIYDNGITFWNNPSEVGDYTLDNSPIN